MVLSFRNQAHPVCLVEYQSVYPIACLQRNLEACLTFYAFPKAHWKTIRTSNGIKRLLDEIKRRCHTIAAAFRTGTSCVLLFYVVNRSLTFHKLTMPLASQAQTDVAHLHNSVSCDDKI